jgi:hypothetical protein
MPAARCPRHGPANTYVQRKTKTWAATQKWHRLCITAVDHLDDQPALSPRNAFGPQLEAQAAISNRAPPCPHLLTPPTGKCRPVVETRSSTTRFRVASTNGSRSSLSCGDGGNVGAHDHCVEWDNVTICSPSGCGQAESGDAARSVHVDSYEEGSRNGLGTRGDNPWAALNGQRLPSQ